MESFLFFFCTLISYFLLTKLCNGERRGPWIYSLNCNILNFFVFKFGIVDQASTKREQSVFVSVLLSELFLRPLKFEETDSCAGDNGFMFKKI